MWRLICQRSTSTPLLLFSATPPAHTWMRGGCSGVRAGIVPLYRLLLVNPRFRARSKPSVLRASLNASPIFVLSTHERDEQDERQSAHADEYRSREDERLYEGEVEPELSLTLALCSCHSYPGPESWPHDPSGDQLVPTTTSFQLTRAPHSHRYFLTAYRSAVCRPPPHPPPSPWS